MRVIHHMSKRLAQPTSGSAPAVLELDLLCEPYRVIDLDAQVANSGLDPSVPEKQLHGPEISRLAVELCDLSSSKE